MITCPLSREEWELILELLEREEAELHCEIRHARFFDVRELLRQKKELVGRLIERIREACSDVVASS